MARRAIEVVVASRRNATYSLVCFMPTYHDRNRARAALRDQIMKHTASQPDFAYSAAEICVDVFRAEPPTAGSNGADPVRPLVPRYYWVIRNGDLKFQDVVWQAVSALVAAAAGAPAMALLASCLPQVLRLCFALKTKGAYLTIDQCQLLVAMKAIKVPASVSDIAARADLGNTAAVEALLSSLTALRCGDGTLVAVVAKAADGLWCCADI